MHVLMSSYSLHQPWIKKYLEPYIHANSRVAILPFSFSDAWIKSPEDWDAAYGENGKYFEEIVVQFRSYGIENTQVKWLNYFKDSPETMKALIHEADIIFLTGGLPEKASERLIALGLVETLKSYKGHIIGASAGSFIQLPAYYCSPDDDYPELCYFKGLGLIEKPYYIEVHYAHSEIQKNCIEKTLESKTQELFALGDNGAILVHEHCEIHLGDIHYFAK